MLVEVEDIYEDQDEREEAISMAESEIERLFEVGDLKEGDKGFVIARRYPDEMDPEDLIHASDDVNMFLAKLDALQETRVKILQYAFDEAMEILANKGISQYALKIRVDTNVVGLYLIEAGNILGSYWYPHCILWCSTEYQAGWLKDSYSYTKILPKIREHPENWWLVNTVVG
jgi:hypothetical protein